MSGSTDNQRPMITVVIPTRDRPQLLERALSSILSQQYDGEIECLVVFDQCEPFVPNTQAPAGRTVLVLQNNRTPGPAGARNTGALACRGDLLAFCDDDDEWLSDKLRLQVQALAANPDAPAVSCGLYVSYQKLWTRQRRRARPVSHSDLLKSRVMELNMSSLVVRRDVFLSEVGPFDEDIPGSYGEDYEWFLRATKIAPVAVVQAALVRLHWHDRHRPVESWKTIISSLHYLLDKHPQLAQSRKGLSRIYGQIALAHAALGERAEARRWAMRCLSLSGVQPRGYIALLVSLGVVRAETVVHLAHRLGRGLV